MLICARCSRAVELNRDSYETFERMHYVCFHYEFEHDADPDVGCFAMGCPSSSLGGIFSYGSLPMSAEGESVWRAKFPGDPPQ